MENLYLILFPYFLLFTFRPEVFIEVSISNFNRLKSEMEDEFDLEFETDEVKEIWKNTVDLYYSSQDIPWAESERKIIDIKNQIDDLDI